MNPSKETNSAQPLLKVSDLKHSFVEGGKYNQVLRGISFSIFFWGTNRSGRTLRLRQKYLTLFARSA